jgi:hypothetical protein
VRSYYASVSGYRDELLWAALWLHRATGRDEYLRYAVDKADSFGGVGWAMTEFSWDVKYAGVQVLAAKVPLAVFLDHQLHLFFFLFFHRHHRYHLPWTHATRVFLRL